MPVEVIPIKVSSSIFKNYSYVIHAKEQEGVIVVDPAWEMDKYKAVFHKIRKLPSHILITHGHHDHINLVEAFSRIFQVEIFISITESEMNALKPRRCTYIETESAFVCGGIEVYPLFTPGHTLGSICYQIEDNLFTGDTLFIEGCGMCFDEKSDPDALYESMMRLKRQYTAPH